MQTKQKTRKGDIILTGSLYVEQEKGQHKTETIPMGPSRGYVVQKEGSRKLGHDGVVTCHEIRRKLDRKTAEGGRRQFRGLL